MRNLSFVPSSVCALLAGVLLSGCASSFETPDNPVSTQTSLGNIQGSVHGGHQPIVGAHVFVLAAGTGSYAGSGIVASTSNASNSLLISYTTGSYPTTKDTTAGDATLNDYYVTTDANGYFGLTGEYTCTAGTQVYIYVSGGNPGSGTNTAVGLMAVLGQCPSGGSFAATVPTVIINEASTVAAAFAFEGFATDVLHVSAPSATDTLAGTGIANAFANAAQLYSLPYGGGGARATTANGNGVVPQTTINALANSLASCVNSSGVNSTQCSTLLGDAKNTASTPLTPTETATAAINIAHSPAANVSAIFGLAAAIGTPFVPTLSSAPTSFILPIQFSGGGLSAPYVVAIDANGNAFVANNRSGANSITKFSALGVPAPTSPFTGGGIDYATAIAVDLNGNVWVSSENNNSISEFNGSTGVAMSTSAGFTGGGLNQPDGIAIDANGNVWVANQNDSISEFTSTGLAVSPSTGFTGGGLVGESSIAVDANGHVWAAGENSPYTLSEFNVSSGTAVSSTGYTGSGLNEPESIAIDAAGDVWVGNYGNGDAVEFNSAGSYLAAHTGISTMYFQAFDGSSNQFLVAYNTADVVEFNSAGTTISPTGGFVGGEVDASGVAVDGSGDVWIANDSNTGTVTEIIGMGTPVVTPMAYAVKHNTIAARP